MNIENIKLIETVKSLNNEIKMLEIERTNNDIKNTNKLKPLYDLYYKNLELLQSKGIKV